MKIFYGQKYSSWGDKINFVDDNNVLVGYDMSSCCCEQFGWVIKDVIDVDAPSESSNKVDELNEELVDYNFDIDFYERDNGSYDDAGGMAIFKLVKEDCNPKYLHLYNYHNGYYSHGFTMEKDSEMIRTDYL